MGIFKKDKKQKKTKQPADVAEQVFDEQYRDELRAMGKMHFKKLLDESSASLKTDIDVILEQLTGSLRRHMASQLDLAITRVNNDISSQFKEKMNEYNRVSGEAQELVIQSLSRNAQSVHEKYQQMSSDMQKVVANQEVMMVGVFQENQAKISSMQEDQQRSMDDLKSSIEAARRQSSEISEAMRSSADEQSEKVNQLYRENLDRLSEMKDSQERSLKTLEEIMESLQSRSEQLDKTIDEHVAKHKSMSVELINNDISRIIEHYLIDALGERSDVTKDLPNILERLEEKKQPMMEDMKL